MWMWMWMCMCVCVLVYTYVSTCVWVCVCACVCVCVFACLRSCEPSTSRVRALGDLATLKKTYRNTNQCKWNCWPLACILPPLWYNPHFPLFLHSMFWFTILVISSLLLLALLLVEVMIERSTESVKSVRTHEFNLGAAFLGLIESLGSTRTFLANRVYMFIMNCLDLAVIEHI